MKNSYYFAGKTAILISIAIPEESDNYQKFGIGIGGNYVYIQDYDEYWDTPIAERITNQVLPETLTYTMDNKQFIGYVPFSTTNSYQRYRLNFLGKHDNNHYLVAITGSSVIIPNRSYNNIRTIYKSDDAVYFNDSSNWIIKTLPDVGKITCGIGNLSDRDKEDSDTSDISGFPQGIQDAINKFVGILNSVTTIDYHIQLTTGNEYKDYLYWQSGSDDGLFEGYLNFASSSTSEVPVTLMDLAGNNLMSNQSNEQNVKDYMAFSTGKENIYWVWRGKVCYPVRGYSQVVQQPNLPQNSCDAYLYKMAAAYQASRGSNNIKYYLYNVLEKISNKYYAQYINGTYVFRIPYYRNININSNIPYNDNDEPKEFYKGRFKIIKNSDNTSKYYIPSQLMKWTQNGENFRIVSDYNIDPFAGKQENVDYVDLELPSGTLWATQNLINDYYSSAPYAWGETIDKTYFAEANYKYYDGSNEYTKYNSSDQIKRLLNEDDVAFFKYGGQWCIPTKEQFEELLANCDLDMEGCQAGRFISKNNNKTIDIGLGLDYWTSDLTSDSEYAYYFESERFGFGSKNRWDSSYIRPVINPNTSFPFKSLIKNVPKQGIILNESQQNELLDALTGYSYSHNIDIPYYLPKGENGPIEYYTFPEEYMNSDQWYIEEFDFNTWDEEMQIRYQIYKNDEKLYRICINTTEDENSYTWKFYLDEQGRPFRIERIENT